MDPLTVTVARGGAVESRHRVHAVRLGPVGEVAEAHGDPGLVTFMRSAAKPLQALLLVRAYDDLADEETAIASASHHARSEQLAAVRMLLERAGAEEEDLECGPIDGSRLRHNCSGKHAGFLCVCAARGWPFESYRLPEHPLQEELAALVYDAAEVAAGEFPTATDGCGVVTFAMPLARMARAFARLARGELEGAERIVAAMTAHPALVEGPGAAATEVMQAVPGAVAKGGAEGVLCVGLPDGTGVAIKAEDGAGRATLPAAAALLDLPELRATTLRNSRGEAVGEVLAES
ncbi:MAG: asparaginase [Gaiellaceae bacterium]